MSHWLDQAAQGLAEGRLTRRTVLRRAGGAAVGVTLASLGLRPARARAQGQPCNSVLPCPAGETCCDGSCVDLQSDISHCGTCRNTCGGQGSDCYQGSCRCGEGGLTYCEKPGYNGGPCDDPLPNCFNLHQDICNCGRCGHICEQDEDCLGGDCVCKDKTRRLASGKCCPEGHLTCGDHCCDLAEKCEGGKCVCKNGKPHCGPRSGSRVCCTKDQECCGKGSSQTCCQKGKCKKGKCEGLCPNLRPCRSSYDCPNVKDWICQPVNRAHCRPGNCRELPGAHTYCFPAARSKVSRSNVGCQICGPGEGVCQVGSYVSPGPDCQTRSVCGRYCCDQHRCTKFNGTVCVEMRGHAYTRGGPAEGCVLAGQGGPQSGLPAGVGDFNQCID
jgi:hypothetical protein